MATKKKAASEVEEAPKKTQVRLLMSKDRMKKHVTVDEIIGMEEGNFGMIRNVLARFVSNDKAGYVSHEEGMEIIGRLTLEQLEESVKAFRDGLKDTASPPMNGSS